MDPGSRQGLDQTSLRPRRTGGITPLASVCRAPSRCCCPGSAMLHFTIAARIASAWSSGASRVPRTRAGVPVILEILPHEHSARLLRADLPLRHARKYGRSWPLNTTPSESRRYGGIDLHSHFEGMTVPRRQAVNRLTRNGPSWFPPIDRKFNGVLQDCTP